MPSFVQNRCFNGIIVKDLHYNVMNIQKKREGIPWILQHYWYRLTMSCIPGC